MKKIIVITTLCFSLLISISASATSKDTILKTCQNLIKQETQIHPRLINIIKTGKYKYTFDVVFIRQGKEVKSMKGSYFDKNYSCEYYPEEDTVYKSFSDKQLSDDKVKYKKDTTINTEKITSFALQLEIYSDINLAKRFRDKLRKDGYPTFIYKDTHKKETTYKVRIGPYIDRDTLNILKKDIRRTYKIDAYIVNNS